MATLHPAPKTMKLLLLAMALPLAAQPPFPTTTLAQATTAQQADPIILANISAVRAPALPVAGGPTIGDPFGYALTIILIDQEAMCVLQPPSKFGAVVVSRGCQGTLTQNHSKGTTAYVGAASWYLQNTPSGSCVAQENPVLPRIVLDNGALYNCVGGNWVLQGYSVKRRVAKWYTAPLRAVRWVWHRLW
jgi:hypothetical protein